MLLAAVFSFGISEVRAAEKYVFINPEQEKVFQLALEQINCPQCDGQSLAESPVAIAEGLRQLVYELALQDYTVERIQEYVLQGYGEAVLRHPVSWLHRFILTALPIFFILCAVWYFRKSLGIRKKLFNEA